MLSERECIRKAILTQKEPFCLSDIVSRLRRKGFNNKSLILDELDDLFSVGLVKYGQTNSGVFAFFVK